MVDSCVRCSELVACRKQIVNGYGKPNARIMIVGQFPSAVDDRDGRPFIGRPGKLLALMAARAGIRLTDIYRTNAVRCTTPGGRNKREPKIDEILNCREHLLDEISRVNPAVIVTMGKVPLTSLYSMDNVIEHERAMSIWESECEDARVDHGRLHEEYAIALDAWEQAPRMARGPKPKKPSKNPKLPPKPKKAAAKQVAVKDIAGHVLIQPDTGIPMIPSYHPSFIGLGNWEYEELVVKHLERARKVADGELDLTPIVPDYPVIEDLNQLEALRDYLLSDEVDCIWFDLETTGTHWLKHDIICLALGGGHPGDTFVVPILHNDGENLVEYWGEDISSVITILKEIFASDKDKGGHNLLFDTRMLERDPVSWIDAGTTFGIKVNLNV